MRITQKSATLRLESDVPAEMWWYNQRWHILDMPTRLGIGDYFLYSPLITHPPEPWTGWRFTGRCEETGESYLFDVKYITADSYEVLRACE